MKRTFECAGDAGMTELGAQELVNISGGSFYDTVAYAIGYVAHVYVGLIADNIEHPIGAEAGYPPR